MRRIVFCLLLLLVTAPGLAQDAIKPDFSGLLPKQETGATRLLGAHPTYDGRGIIVAIFDTGVDPGAPGLQTTTDGQVKIIDVLDATGSGDVTLASPVKAAADHTLPGLTGRTLKLDPAWKNPTGEFRLGWKAAYDFFPNALVSRMKRDRREALEKEVHRSEAELLTKIQKLEADSAAQKNGALADQRERLKQLREAAKEATDPGPIFDCVVFHNGERWCGVVDTDEDGDLADESPLAAYRHGHEYGTFDIDEALLNFSLDIADDGKSLAIVVDAGAHGTHVAGIVGAHFPDVPNMNGIAPGVQIVSVKIGDPRLGSMETGIALERAAQLAADRGCHLVNMSYGEPTRLPNAGRLAEVFTRLVQQHNVIFVASAGNSGPALSSVGAPGGTTSALLGIGAYISPEMMQAEYTLRARLPELAYTWTSRGPTFDGDLGVDLMAPGGAVAPVPPWTLRRSMQMNGTSMASPNACGNVALLLSALRQTNQPWTVPGSRRALKNTARVVPELEPFTQGAGLIQVDKALDYLLRDQDPKQQLAAQKENKKQREQKPGHFPKSTSTSPANQPWWFDVRVAATGSPRGILLREAYETQHPLETTVRVTPKRSDEERTDRRLLEVEYQLVLEATEDWVHVGPTLLLVGGSQSFDVRVEPEDLSPGSHYAEIRAFEADNREAGPLFRVPISVLKPAEIPAGETSFSSELELQPGSDLRHFLQVPVGATWADLTLTPLSADSDRRYLVQTTQSQGGQSFEDSEFKQFITLAGGEPQRRSFAVTAGRTLEICIAQYWSSLGQSEVQLQVDFHGLTPSNETLVLDDALSTPVRITSELEATPLKPEAQFTRWRRSLLPTKAQLQPVAQDLAVSLEPAALFQLELSYQFEQSAAGEVTLRFPWNEGVLYDSQLAGLLWHVYDGDNYRVATGDSWDHSVKLREGPKSVRLYLQHSDPDLLERYRGAPLELERALKSAHSVQFYSSEDAVRAKSSTIGERLLQRGEQTTVFAALAQPWKFASELQAGDRLLGHVSWCARSGGTGTAHRPGGFPLRMVVPEVTQPKSESSSSPEKEEKSGLATALWKAQLAELKRLSGPKHAEEFEQLVTLMLVEKPNNLEVLVQRLAHLDNVPAFRKQHLDEVVAAADAVIAQIDTHAIERDAARAVLPDDEDAQRRHREAQELRETLVDTLYRRGRAIGYMELPDVLKHRPITDEAAQHKAFEATFAELRRWVDTKEKRYFLLHVRRERRMGHYGQALETLNAQMKDAPLNFWYHKKRRDLYLDLGWKTLAEWEQRWLTRMFPDRIEEAKLAQD